MLAGWLGDANIALRYSNKLCHMTASNDDMSVCTLVAHVPTDNVLAAMLPGKLTVTSRIA
jgi:hypothetical protein